MTEQDLKQFHDLIRENERLTRELAEKRKPDWAALWFYVPIMWAIYGLIQQFIHTL